MARQIVNLEKLAEAQWPPFGGWAAAIPKPPPPRPPKPPPPPPPLAAIEARILDANRAAAG